MSLSDLLIYTIERNDVQAMVLQLGVIGLIFASIFLSIVFRSFFPILAAPIIFFPVINKARQVFSYVEWPYLVTPFTYFVVLSLPILAIYIYRFSKLREDICFFLFALILCFVPILNLLIGESFNSFTYLRSLFLAWEAFLIGFSVVVIARLYGLKRAEQCLEGWFYVTIVFIVFEFAVRHGTNVFAIFIATGLREGDKSAVSAGFFEILAYADVLVFFVFWFAYRQKYFLMSVSLLLILLSLTRGAFVGVLAGFAVVALVLIQLWWRREGGRIDPQLRISKPVLMRLAISIPLLAVFALPFIYGVDLTSRLVGQVSTGAIDRSYINFLGLGLSENFHYKASNLLETTGSLFAQPLGYSGFGNPHFQIDPSLEGAEWYFVAFLFLFPAIPFFGFGLFPTLVGVAACVAVLKRLFTGAGRLWILGAGYAAFLVANVFNSAMPWWAPVSMIEAEPSTLAERHMSLFNSIGRLFVHHNDGILWYFIVTFFVISYTSDYLSGKNVDTERPVIK